MDHAAQHRRNLLGKRKSMSENAKNILSVIVVLAVYVVAGTMDYNDAVGSENETRAETVCRSN